VSKSPHKGKGPSQEKRPCKECAVATSCYCRRRPPRCSQKVFPVAPRRSISQNQSEHMAQMQLWERDITTPRTFSLFFRYGSTPLHRRSRGGVRRSAGQSNAGNKGFSSPIFCIRFAVRLLAFLLNRSLTVNASNRLDILAIPLDEGEGNVKYAL
jgi:hypothetical protein